VYIVWCVCVCVCVCVCGVHTEAWGRARNRAQILRAGSLAPGGRMMREVVQWCVWGQGTFAEARGMADCMSVVWKTIQIWTF